MNIFGYSIAREIIVKVLGVVLVMVLFVVVLGQCEKRREAAAKARVEREAAKAQVESGKDAIATVTRRGAEETASEALTRDNERDIRSAPGAGERVDPGIDVAGRRALCKREAYRDDPRCAMFRKEK
jgi:hypothetical protein